MEEYKFLLDIAIILAMTKSFSLVSKKFNMPPVVGALIAGIILGPVVLNVVSPSDSVLNLAEVGVVVLMFQAGLETDIDELKKSGIPAFVIALCGVLITVEDLESDDEEGALLLYRYNEDPEDPDTFSLDNIETDEEYETVTAVLDEILEDEE